MIYMKINDIRIKESFAKTIPANTKLLNCKNYWNRYHKQDRYIVIDHNHTLIDGYIQYLVLKEAGVDIVEVKISDRRMKKWHRKNRNLKKHNLKVKKISYKECDTVYVFGVLLYSNSKKERIWRIPNSWKKERIDELNIGDVVIVHNQKGLSPIQITRIENYNECPVDIPVKKVVTKYKQIKERIK